MVHQWANRTAGKEPRCFGGQNTAGLAGQRGCSATPVDGTLESHVLRINEVLQVLLDLPIVLCILQAFTESEEPGS